MSTVLQIEPTPSTRQRRSPHCDKVRRLSNRPAVAQHQARVLIAEDDKDMRRLLAGAFRAAGYAVVQVADGRTLLDRLARGLLGKKEILPDLIVSDIRMPGMTGLEVLAGLRQADWAMPVILLTAFGDDETHAEAKRLGAALLLDKPFDVDELLDAVHTIVPAYF